MVVLTEIEKLKNIATTISLLLSFIFLSAFSYDILHSVYSCTNILRGQNQGEKYPKLVFQFQVADAKCQL